MLNCHSINFNFKFFLAFIFSFLNFNARAVNYEDLVGYDSRTLPEMNAKYLLIKPFACYFPILEDGTLASIHKVGPSNCWPSNPWVSTVRIERHQQNIALNTKICTII